MIKLSIADKVDKIKSILNLWQGRVLTLTGKITILKSLVLPHILHLAYVLPLCETLLMDLDKLFFDFVWNKGKHLVSKQTLLQSYDMGGPKMLSITDMVKTAKIMWVKRFSNEINAKWKVLSENLMGLNREQLFYKSMFKYIKLKPQTAFYSDLLSIWFHFVTVEPMTFKELLEEKKNVSPFMSLCLPISSQITLIFFNSSCHDESTLCNSLPLHIGNNPSVTF